MIPIIFNSILSLGYLFLKIFFNFKNEFLCIFVSIFLLNSFLPFTIFAAPQSRWLITISLFILCNFTEVLKFSQKVLCHFLNLFDVTPIADPAMVKELYFPIKFFFLNN